VSAYGVEYLSTTYKIQTVAPNGIMYVKPEVRKGLLGRMLTELLETRVMVKQALKGVKNDDVGFFSMPPLDILIFLPGFAKNTGRQTT
jgi:hypothetical protein